MSMHVLIAGGSGLVGSAVAEALRARGDRVSVGSRGGGEGKVRYDALPGDVDAVVNVAGAGIASRRWNDAYERELWTSRVDFTRMLTARLRERGVRPRVWVNASAVGIYGDRGSERIDEDTPPGTGFLADLCRAWETEAAAASTLGARVAVLRIGIVLTRHGGALPKMALPFKLFVGGPIGRGRFFVAWIHLDDLVRLFVAALDDERFRGTYNATAPNPCTNAELSRALARALHRPNLLPVPPLALRVVLGKLGRHVTESQRVLPARALAAGFTFTHATIESAFAAEYGR